ncbi:MAG: aminotransferase class III-fold pyridoxal phosphate-dependent enzyme [Canibacter sp.]
MSSRIKTELPGPKSQAIHDEKLQYVANAVAPALPVYVDHADGSVITDVDGNELLDFASGIGVISFGHGTGNESMKAQIDKFTHTLFTIAPYDLYVQVCRELDQLAPGDFEKKTALSSTGAEAIENAIKVARSYTGRNGIAVVDHAYHGRTNLTLGLNYKALPYSSGAGPRQGEIYRAQNSYKFRDGKDGQTAARDAIAYLEKISGASNLACILIEPIQGEGGVIVPEDGFLSTLQEWARENGIVVIADEIQTGLGRTGTVFASEHFGFEPDLVVTAKAIGAGIPLSAVTGRKEIMDAMAAGSLSGTFSGNPVGCAAALDVFKLLRDDEVLAHGKKIGEKIQAGLKELQQKHPVIGDVRGLGALHGIELVNEDGTPNGAAFKALHAGCAKRGLLVLPGGSDGHVLRLLPAVNISEELVDEALQILGDALADLDS